MPLKRFDLHVPVSEDGRTTFAEIADILDHLATLYAWHPDAYGFLVTRAYDARQIDTIYEKEPTDDELHEDAIVGCIDTYGHGPDEE